MSFFIFILVLMINLLFPVTPFLDLTLFQPDIMQAGTIVPTSSSFSISGAQYELIERVRRIGSPTTGAIAAPPLPHTNFVTDITNSLTRSNEIDSFESILYSESCSIANEAIVKSNGEALGSESSQYATNEKIGRGHEGEVWRARRIDDNKNNNDNDDNYVIKRLFPGRGAIRSGWREIHFGLEFRNISGITRFIEYFTRTSSSSTENENELWLVFKDEGVSLQSLLFSRIHNGLALVPTPFWIRLRKSNEGKSVYKKIAKSLIDSLSRIHLRNHTMHRDIKPGNVLVGTEKGSLEIKLADFGSAIDDYSLQFLYDSEGPSLNEQTSDFSPPETIISGQPFYLSRPQSYDAFSLGVLLLEILLGQTSSSIFAPPAKVAAILRQQFDTDNTNDDNGQFISALRIAGFLSLCIAPPLDDNTPAVALVRKAIARAGGGFKGEECGLAGFRKALRILDAQATLRANKLSASALAEQTLQSSLQTSTTTSSSSSSLISSSIVFNTWASGGNNNALLNLRSNEATLAVFGVEALVPWTPLATSSSSSSLSSSSLPPPPPPPPLIYSNNDISTLESSEMPTSSSSSPTPPSSLSLPVSFLGEEGEDFLFELLMWNPTKRLIPIEAVQHIYFKNYNTLDKDNEEL